MSLSSQEPKIGAEIVALEFIPVGWRAAILEMPVLKLRQGLAVVAFGVGLEFAGSFGGGAAIGRQVSEKIGDPPVGSWR